jgi:peptide/nickel transport system permease protein
MTTSTETPTVHGIWRTFRRSKMGMVGAFMLIVAILMAIFAPYLAPFDPKAQVRVTIEDIYTPPDSTYLLGRDDAGKDVLSNFFTDIMLVIPDFPLIVLLVALTKPSLLNIILVIGLLGWTGSARLVRAQTIAVKQRKFVLRAQAIGAGHGHIIRHHIFPLVLPLIVVNTVLVISLAILNESALSFLGLSDPTQLSWGQMLNFAFTRGAMSSGAWWALVTPGLGIVWLVLGCTLLGQGLERVLNPRLESHHLSVGAKMVAREVRPPPQPEASDGLVTGD